MVLEGMPWQLGEEISKNVGIPTIGIGGGPYCDGQVLVVNDLLGMDGEFTPRFVKRYAEVGKEMSRAFEAYIKDVRDGKFPDLDHSYSRD
jgi:3-methyl-2-oxobutanoate hydroxymethyltransferase